MGVPESFLHFKLADQFNAPGVFEQSHFVMGTSSTGAIKVEEEERGAGSGESFYLFCIERGLEIYLSFYTGDGGELALLVTCDSGACDICPRLAAAMGSPWPSHSNNIDQPISPDRLAIHQHRLTSLRENVQKWL
ncbi:MAG TPA: hypothetical protein VKU80_18415 [Planctomycetota bacterium]|nr:hypothetical protein [Planctomycetota bacterium]